MYSTEEAIILGARVVDGYRTLLDGEQIHAGDKVYTLRTQPIKCGETIGRLWHVKQSARMEIEYKNGSRVVSEIIIIEEPVSGMTAHAHYSDLWVKIDD